LVADPYTVLELQNTASQDDIQKAYWRLAKNLACARLILVSVFLSRAQPCLGPVSRVRPVSKMDERAARLPGRGDDARECRLRL
jgi:hypothetical protein